MALTKVTSGVRTLGTGEVTAANLAAGAVDTSGLEDDIALLGFRVASNGSLAKYNLVDQTVDDFQDASGVDASASTGEARDSSGKYYKGEAASTPTVSGNWDSTAVDGAYTYYKWTTVTSSGTYTTNNAQDYEYLVVAGGGGGGGSGTGGNAGAGGAGGFRTATGFAVAATTISGITIGAGGVGAVYSGVAGTGGNSVFSSITSTGGGGGGDYDSNATTGGSGGGGTTGGGGGSPTGASGTVGQGNAGGDSGGTADDYGGGGGGGAGAVGGNGGTTDGGNGGNGTANSITGASVTYAGGGGGGADSGGTAGTGGTGGGGAGCQSTGCTATAGTANTGGGGGGSGEGGGPSGSTGGTGGTGIVVIRRPTTSTSEGADMVLVSTTTAAQAAPTKGDVVFTYTNGAGTTTLGTDVTAEISADGGSTWTALALASEGSTGSHNIATSHDVTISSTITAPYNMAYRIKTLNQSASKTTRIQAVSLGWS